jgi:hypothetical protein
VSMYERRSFVTGSPSIPRLAKFKRLSHTRPLYAARYCCFREIITLVQEQQRVGYVLAKQVLCQLSYTPIAIGSVGATASSMLRIPSSYRK